MAHSTLAYLVAHMGLRLNGLRMVYAMTDLQIHAFRLYRETQQEAYFTLAHALMLANAANDE